jgi:hypothetical protein
LFLNINIGKNMKLNLVLCSTGSPVLTGLSDVSGTGQLATGSNGTAEGLIVPYSAAAPTTATVYRIGGTLLYSVNGDQLTIPLFPDSVTVQPDPRLKMIYFLEKNVYSYNRLTPQGRSGFVDSLSYGE